jgi:uncharacterized protein (DUF362 family)
VAAGAIPLGWLRAGDEPPLPKDILSVPDRSAAAPAAPVGIVRCPTYEMDALKKALSEAMDLTGGLGKLVGGKTVTVKLNTTGNGRQKMCGLPSERTYQVHPRMVEVLCGLFHQAGAKRIVLVESFYENRKPEEILARQGWDVERITAASDGTAVFADTRNRGEFKDYAVLKVPYGGYVFGQYHLNRHYLDTDVFVSLAKLKNHITAGITCSVKNLFGIAPTSLYGNDSPNERTTENRGAILHDGKRAVPAGVDAERYTDTPRVGYYRVPRVTADLFSIRPVDLAIVDGIESVFGGEGPWCPPPLRATKPGVIIAGRNAVTVDAVSVGVMGYDPQAAYQVRPFPGENHLNLLARAGLGTNDLGKIEVRGLALKEALHEYEPGGKPGWVRRHLGS